MSWFVIFLGLILALAGAWGFYASVDLLTTQLGLLYAICGAVAVSGGCIVIAIGLLMRRVDALRRALAPSVETTPRARVEPLAPALDPTLVDGTARPAPTVEFAEPAIAPAPDDAERERAVNENRKGRSPSPDAPEQAAQEPAAPPSLVGRYSAGGANYSIYSDGSIEAETDQGAFKFGSMNEFKAFIAAKRN